MEYGDDLIKTLNFRKIVGPNNFEVDSLTEILLQKDIKPSLLARVLSNNQYSVKVQTGERDHEVGHYQFMLRKKSYKVDGDMLSLSVFKSLVEETTQKLSILPSRITKETSPHIMGYVTRIFSLGKNVMTNFPQFIDDITETTIQFYSEIKTKLDEAAKVLGVESYGITLGLSPSITFTFKIERNNETQN